jgi:hypothetical protein
MISPIGVLHLSVTSNPLSFSTVTSYLSHVSDLTDAFGATISEVEDPLDDCFVEDDEDESEDEDSDSLSLEDWLVFPHPANVSTIAAEAIAPAISFFFVIDLNYTTGAIGRKAGLSSLWG